MQRQSLTPVDNRVRPPPGVPNSIITVDNMRIGHRGDSFRGCCARLTRRITRLPRHVPKNVLASRALHHPMGPYYPAGGVRVGEDFGVNPVPGAICAEPAVSLPGRLPGAELRWQVTPGRAGPDPPDHALNHPPVVPERTAALAGSIRHQRLDPSPCSIREGTSSRHGSSTPWFTTPG